MPVARRVFLFVDGTCSCAMNDLQKKKAVCCCRPTWSRSWYCNKDLSDNNEPGVTRDGKTWHDICSDPPERGIWSRIVEGEKVRAVFDDGLVKGQDLHLLQREDEKKQTPTNPNKKRHKKNKIKTQVSLGRKNEANTHIDHAIWHIHTYMQHTIGTRRTDSTNYRRRNRTEQAAEQRSQLIENATRGANGGTQQQQQQLAAEE